MNAAIPNPAKVMYKASISAIAITSDNPTKSPCAVAVVKTSKHIGPTASCSSIPNLKPFQIILNPFLRRPSAYIKYMPRFTQAHTLRVKDL